MFCRDIPSRSATSVSPTRSGLTSTSSAPGTARCTSSTAEHSATTALSASRQKASSILPGKPLPRSASSHPASASRRSSTPTSS
ncbi:hypothetical protein G6F32_015080 [Rhizopus arrhizus]|nr:hypothetical protein G6F32_015080 [Rhizopus arrhizus]